MPVLLLAAFSLLGAGYIALTVHGDFTFSFVLKILPLLLLLAYVLKRQGKAQGALLAALLFCMLGDVLLALDGNALFVYGLGAFLLGHLAYLINLRPFQRFYAALLLPYLAVAGIIVSLMWPQLGAMALPVLVYITVILTMSFATWCSRASNVWLISGGLLFISSDALIGLNKFYQPLPYAGTLIMLTYYGAQYLLVMGFVTGPRINGPDKSTDSLNR